MQNVNSRVRFNVGGTTIETFLSTVRGIAYFDKLFYTMVGAGDSAATNASVGRETQPTEYFIDADPKIFRQYLNTIQNNNYQVPDKYAQAVVAMTHYFAGTVCVVSTVPNYVQRTETSGHYGANCYITFNITNLAHFVIDEGKPVRAELRYGNKLITDVGLLKKVKRGRYKLSKFGWKVVVASNGPLLMLQISGNIFKVTCICERVE